ncbi:MAG: hypothetical protein K2M98_00390, partial [Muribaculum sp.]|nr:hypothetical protein [Muribaculum sp.]
MKKKSRKILLSVFLTIIVIVAVTITTAVSFAGKKYHGDDRMMYIPRNADYTMIADTLRSATGDAGVNAAHMLQWRGIAESRMHGAYMLRAGM